jgi:hypothetical protein
MDYYYHYRDEFLSRQRIRLPKVAADKWERLLEKMDGARFIKVQLAAAQRDIITTATSKPATLALPASSLSSSLLAQKVKTETSSSLVEDDDFWEKVVHTSDAQLAAKQQPTTSPFFDSSSSRQGRGVPQQLRPITPPLPSSHRAVSSSSNVSTTTSSPNQLGKSKKATTLTLAVAPKQVTSGVATSTKSPFVNDQSFFDAFESPKTASTTSNSNAKAKESDHHQRERQAQLSKLSLFDDYNNDITNSSSSNTNGTRRATITVNDDDDKTRRDISTMTKMGFSLIDATRALTTKKGNIEEAIGALLLDQIRQAKATPTTTPLPGAPSPDHNRTDEHEHGEHGGNYYERHHDIIEINDDDNNHRLQAQAEAEADSRFVPVSPPHEYETESEYEPALPIRSFTPPPTISSSSSRSSDYKKKDRSPSSSSVSSSASLWKSKRDREKEAAEGPADVWAVYDKERPNTFKDKDNKEDKSTSRNSVVPLLTL